MYSIAVYLVLLQKTISCLVIVKQHLRCMLAGAYIQGLVLNPDPESESESEASEDSQDPGSRSVSPEMDDVKGQG